MLGPKNPASSVCWCLSHRIDAKTNRELVGPARGDFFFGSGAEAGRRAGLLRHPVRFVVLQPKPRS